MKHGNYYCCIHFFERKYSSSSRYKLTRVDNGGVVEGVALLQTDPLPVTHAIPAEPDVLSYHIEGSCLLEEQSATTCIWSALRWQQKKNNAFPRICKGLARPSVIASIYINGTKFEKKCYNLRWIADNISLDDETGQLSPKQLITKNKFFRHVCSTSTSIFNA